MSDATMKDVAKRAGVSIATASRVLNGSDKVIDETRDKVLKACKELDFSLNSVAQRLRLGKTNTICVVLPFLTLPSIVERLRGALEPLLESNLDLIPYSVGSPEMRDKRIHDLADRSRADGVMIISLPINDQQAERLLKNKMPVMLIDSERPEFSRVNMDDVEGGRMATQHLLDLGHRKIAFLSSHLENPLQFSSTLNRYHGYCNALEGAGVPLNPDYQIEGDHGREEAELMALALLSKADPPTAIFASSDTKAIGVLDAAKKKGIKVPEQLSVIGYDDIRDAEFVALTTIKQPLFLSGKLGCEMLLAIIEQPNSNLKEIILPVELVVRNTTALVSR